MGIVATYKYMGTLTAAAAPAAEEIAGRRKALRQSAALLSRNVLKNDKVDMTVKTLVVHMHVSSKGLYNCSAWPLLHRAEIEALSCALMAAYRKLLPDMFHRDKGVW